MSWIPGQHVYLHVPAISAGGHPFSVATVSRALDESGNDGWGETLRSWWAFVKGKGLHCPKVRQQVMIIRVREGLTRKLYEYAQANMEDGGKVGIYAWTEGESPTASLAILPKLFR